MRADHLIQMWDWLCGHVVFQKREISPHNSSVGKKTDIINNELLNKAVIKCIPLSLSSSGMGWGGFKQHDSCMDLQRLG